MHILGFLTLKYMETKRFQFSMARKRVKLAYITDAASRKAAYRKRNKGLVKKLSELTTLCGTEACAVIYSHASDYQPEVWPLASGAQQMLSEFKALPDVERSSRMVNSEGFLKQRLANVNEQLERQNEENRRNELTQLMFQNLGGKGFQNVRNEDLDELGELIKQNLKVIDNRLHMLINGYVVGEK